jgi:hypothetical protein
MFTIKPHNIIMLIIDKKNAVNKYMRLIFVFLMLCSQWANADSVNQAKPFTIFYSSNILAEIDPCG